MTLEYVDDIPATTKRIIDQTIVNELAANPNKWAIIREYASAGSAHSLVRSWAKLRSKPKGGDRVEVVRRGRVVYARYVP